MMSCVNRECSRPLASFSDGRLFHFEILSISVSADDGARRDFDEIPHRASVQYWLCGSCSGTMTLTMEPLSGLQLVPLEVVLKQSLPDTSRTFPEMARAAHQG